MNIPKPEPKQKMSDDAKKVFTGVVFDVYQWEQKRFDGTKSTFEMLERADVVCLLGVTMDKKIIVTEEKQSGFQEGFTNVPAGEIDKGEDLEEAAQRELLEETGYECQSLEYLDTNQPSDRNYWFIHTVVAKNCKKVSKQKLDPAKKIKVKLLSFNEFVEYAICKEFRSLPIRLMFMEAKIYPKKMEQLRKLLLG